ncbi:HEPN domain-containing protein [Desulfatirhabdium butyrativorans]|uniref:HEPN domain-containing protein n=1 Tax=Desulfatirhabdium butyrativorans TaxID=340467 RepID=UPI0003F64F37|nr:HEPN domain-containing protein [Desulfatirhabdium butyrativorans]
MTKDEHIAYWLAESDKDLVVMHSMFANGHYTWALFVGHLALEKSLKALFAARIDIQVPRVHHLLKIARDCGIMLTGEQEDFLLEVTAYNTKARYPDYKQSFARKATRDYTSSKLERIKEMQLWIKSHVSEQ